MQKRCIICGQDFTSKSNRRDNVTCSVACRSKLARQRRKAEAERQARLLSPNDESMLTWLAQNVPDAEYKLRKLRAIHGNEAFTLASEALQAFGRYKVKSPR